MQIAIVLYPGMTALDAVGPYEVLRMIPGSEIRFVSREPGPIVTDSGVLVLGASTRWRVPRCYAGPRILVTS
jgi:putative intracellular protease/amidase